MTRGLVVLLLLFAPLGCSSRKPAESRWVPLAEPREAAPSASPGLLLDSVVAWVNSSPITLSELEEARAHYESVGLLEFSPGPPTEARLNAALERHIDDLLIKAHAEKRGMVAPPELVENHVSETVRQMERNRGGAAELDLFLEQSGASRESLRAELRRWFRHDWLVAQAVYSRLSIGDAELERFVREREERSEPVERWHLLHAHLPLSGSASTEAVTAGRQALEDLLERFRETGSFAEAADAFAAGNRSRGAVALRLPDMTPDEMQKELADAVRSLEPGQASGVLRTMTGLHVFYVERKVDARRILTANLFDEERLKLRGELRKSATIQELTPLLEPGQ